MQYSALTITTDVDSFLFWRRKTDLGAVYSRKSGCENHSRNYD